MAAKQGFLNYYSDSDAIGIKVSVRYRRSGRTSGVVVERSSTVLLVGRAVCMQISGSMFTRFSCFDIGTAYIIRTDNHQFFKT